MNNPTILDIALGFILHKHSRDKFGHKNKNQLSEQHFPADVGYSRYARAVLF